MASRLLAALDYADQGRSVVPVEPNSKIPAVRWARFQVERATEQQIRRWWDFADFNVGIVCGRISNLVVLDVDLRAGGDSSLASWRPPTVQLAAWRWPPRVVPTAGSPTPVAASPTPPPPSAPAWT